MKPFIFEQILIEKIWGGDWLKSLQKNSLYEKVGEAIIMGEENSCKNTEVKWNESTKLRLFNLPYSPIMIKLLDAREDLSVQVHPLRGKNVKAEAWYVLEADEDAQIVYGLKGRLEDFQKALLEGYDIEPYLNKINVQMGDFIYLPPGTVHALGKGIRVLEIQQNSDTTYRLYDYGRGREIHIKEGLNSIDKEINYNSPSIVRNVKKQEFSLGSYLVQGYFKDIDSFDYSFESQYFIIVTLDKSMRYVLDNEEYIQPPYTAALLPQMPQISKQEKDKPYIVFLFDKVDRKSQGVVVV